VGKIARCRAGGIRGEKPLTGGAVAGRAIRVALERMQHRSHLLDVHLLAHPLAR
jgi:hypothetical protein